MDEAKVIEMIKINPIVIKNISSPTEEMKKIAIEKDGLLLRYIKNPLMREKKRISNLFILLSLP